MKYDVVVMCVDVLERYFGENNVLWWDVKWWVIFMMKIIVKIYVYNVIWNLN